MLLICYFLFSDLDSALVFEVTPLSLTQISITFEHPIKDSMATGKLSYTAMLILQLYLYEIMGNWITPSVRSSLLSQNNCDC